MTSLAIQVLQDAADFMQKRGKSPTYLYILPDVYIRLLNENPIMDVHYFAGLKVEVTTSMPENAMKREFFVA